MAAALARRGHEVEVVCDRTRYGRGQIILRAPDSGVLCGGSEPYFDDVKTGASSLTPSQLRGYAIDSQVLFAIGMAPMPQGCSCQLILF
jgi:hypothetical protein